MSPIGKYLPADERREVTVAAVIELAAELDPDLDHEGAAILFIGTIQGLIMQSLLAGNVGHIHKHAPRVFTIYRRGIRRAQ